MATHEEQVNINDASAHLEVLRGNIRVASEELSKALKQKEDAEKILPLVLEENAKANDELTKVLNKVEEETNRVETLKSKYGKLTAELEEEYQDKMKTLKAEKQLLESAVERSAIRKVEAEKELANKIEEVNSLSAKLPDLKKSVEDYQNRKEIAIRESQKASEEIEPIKKALKAVESELSEKREELKKIKGEIKVNIKNIEVPMASLKVKEQAFNSKFRDFVILIKRAQKVFDEIYPGQSIVKMLNLEEIEEIID